MRPSVVESPQHLFITSTGKTLFIPLSKMGWGTNMTEVVVVQFGQLRSIAIQRHSILTSCGLRYWLLRDFIGAMLVFGSLVHWCQLYSHRTRKLS